MTERRMHSRKEKPAPVRHRARAFSQLLTIIWKGPTDGQRNETYRSAC